MLASPVKDKVLLIEDEASILQFLTMQVQKMGCQPLGAASLEAAERMMEIHPDCRIFLSDERMTDGSGLDFLMKIHGRMPDAIRILTTGYPDQDVLLKAINDGQIFRFIPKSFKVETVEGVLRQALERVSLVRDNDRLHNELIHSNQQLRMALSSSVGLCVNVLDRFNHLLASHSERVEKWSLAIGKRMGLSEKKLDVLSVAARMHDIGMVSVSRRFHQYQQVDFQKLPLHQKAALQEHPRAGAQLVGFFPEEEVSKVILCHHEWHNGQGYPNNLAGESIPLLSAIMSVPDAYDEINLLPRSDAKAFVEQNIGIRFLPQVAHIFLQILATCPEYSYREQEVTVDQLKLDMKLTCDVYNNVGILIIPKGRVLDEKGIMFIRRFHASDPLMQRIYVEMS